MARLDRMSVQERESFLNRPCPSFDATPWVVGPPLKDMKIALISTAGVHRRSDRPFTPAAIDYRLIPADTPSSELVMSHTSTNFDRTGFQQDWNVVFPLDRLRELAEVGEIGQVAQYHYAFMGATDPDALEPRARELGQIMRVEGVDAALLVPV